MPLYEYRCKSCEHEWDQFHAVGTHIRTCPECKSRSAERLISIPVIRTESTFAAGYGTLADQLGDGDRLKVVTRRAREHGYTPNASDVYMPTLARFAGDPKAFFRGDVAADMKRHAEQTGRGLEGRIEVKAREPEGPPKKCRLAPHIVERIRREKIAENPDLARTDQQELRASIVDKHGSPE